MGRFLILYLYGGLYADLDVLPNRDRYDLCSLGICRMRARKPAHKWEWEMEVLVATAGNPILMEYLQHIVQEVASRKYETGFFRHARCRYIYHTTGPSSLARFLKDPSRKAVRRQLIFFELNRPEIANVLSAWAKQSYDVISHFSMSYDTKELQIPVLVSKASVDLPCRPPVDRKRLSSKRAWHVFVNGDVLGKPAPSQMLVAVVKDEEGVEKEEDSEVDAIVESQLFIVQNADFDSPGHLEIAEGSRAVRRRLRSGGMVRASDDEGIGAQQEMVEALSQRCERAETLNVAWAEHMVSHWNCVASQQVLADAPQVVANHLQGAYVEHENAKRAAQQASRSVRTHRV
jgi:hypothetical protein